MQALKTKAIVVNLHYLEVYMSILSDCMFHYVPHDNRFILGFREH